MKHILIVDDSPNIWEIMRATLEQQAWQVHEAADGPEAIEKVQKLKPDVVVLDMSMPGLDGLETARELKRLSPSLPLLMFTNFASPQQLTEEALAAGIAAVVSKDEMQDLIYSLHAVLASS